ncbi:MFS transporter [Paenibacillus sp. WQ 127069]|uniref:MFS transporter n=1 Tax=Paenibacillus baimaensis TaxID=2982185 RepID=A0ABT2UHI5_9BACL|nr:MFS transporter [Paenibacillus sp. WQ 127069]MCU6794116.1 MFS transporter [Paenibacillus sp. WQ 127069]
MPSLDLYRKVGIYGGGLFFAITGMAQPFFTLYAQEVGASTSAIGFMVTLRSLLPIFIAMPVGQLIDSIGSMKMLKWGSILLILSLFTTYYGNGLWMLSISQFFMGACIVIMASALQVLVSDGDKNQRNENINKYSMWMSGGGMLGPLIGGGIVSLFATELIGYKISFLIAGFASILFLAFILIISRGYPHPDPNLAEIKPRDIIRVQGIVDSYTSGWHLTKIRAVQFGLIGTFLIMYIQALYMSFMPLYLKELGYSTFLISIVLAIRGLAGMLSRYALNWIMKRTHLERILLIAGMIASVCVLLTPLAGLHIAGIVALMLIMGAAVGINLPVSIMIVVNDTRDADRGKLMGLRLLTNRFSQIISPAMFGILGQTLGLSFAFLTGGIFLVAMMFGFSVYTSAKWNLKTTGREAGGSKPEAAPGNQAS